MKHQHYSGMLWPIYSQGTQIG